MADVKATDDQTSVLIKMEQGTQPESLRKSPRRACKRKLTTDPTGNQHKDDAVRDDTKDNADSASDADADSSSSTSGSESEEEEKPSVPDDGKLPRAQKGCRKFRYTLPSGGRSSVKWLRKNRPYYLDDRCQTCRCGSHSAGRTPKHKDKRSRCRIYYPLHIIEDNAVDRINTGLSSLKSLPTELCVRPRAEDNKLRVYAAQDIKAYTQLGPVWGEVLADTDIKALEMTDVEHLWFMPHSTQREASYQSTADETKSNWCCYLRQTSFDEDHNVAVIAKDNQIFLVTKKPIAATEELVCTVPYFGHPDKIFDHESSETECTRCKEDFGVDGEGGLMYQKHWWLDHPYGWRCTMKSLCEICGILLYSQSHRTRHYQTEHGWLRATCKCDICGKFLLDYRSMIDHKERMHPAKNVVIPCRKCKATFASEISLKQHTYIAHPVDETVLKCEQCNKTFSNRTSIKRHMTLHDGTSPRHTCEVCGKPFRCLTNLKVHMLTHSKLKPFQCQENGCDAGFTTKQCLQVHYRKTHAYTNANMPPIQRTVPLTLDARVDHIHTDQPQGGVVHAQQAAETNQVNALQPVLTNTAVVTSLMNEIQGGASLIELPAQVQIQGGETLVELAPQMQSEFTGHGYPSATVFKAPTGEQNFAFVDHL